MNPYLQFVAAYTKLLREGRSYPLGTFDPLPRPEVDDDAPKVLIFSPHPDDEVVIGGLALRLLRESKWNVINVAVTQGSNKARQPERLQELKNCCNCIGFGLVQTSPNGLERITMKARTEEPAHWLRCVDTIADILKQHRPRVILFPHEADWNTAHVGTHFLVLDALQRLPADFNCYTVETEYWGPNPAPNLMVELGEQEVADLITALTFHVGELQRNPYHLTMPAWMIDTVRRGAELVGGQGGAAPDFTFAILYRLRQWTKGKLADHCRGGRQLSRTEKPESLFL
jgi:N-acetylglucosamine malate deacetylase 1